MGREAERQASRQLCNVTDRGRRQTDRQVGRSGKQTDEVNGQRIRQPKQTHSDMDEYAIRQGSDIYSNGDKTEGKRIGVPTRQVDRHVKSDQPASRKSGTWLTKKESHALS